MRLTTSGVPRDLRQSVVGAITLEDLPLDRRRARIRLFTEGESPGAGGYDGYEAVLSVADFESMAGQPRVVLLRDFDHFSEGDVVALDPASGFVRSLYRPADTHHSIFVTERCNSNCLMCSQPPKDRDDVDELTARNLQLIRLMQPPPSYVTITGGEPTLLGRSLFALLTELKNALPTTEVHILTNGRTFAWAQYTEQFAKIGHPRISVGVPLYSDNSGDHDYIVQAKGAFDQTIGGFHQLARYGIRCEVRVVLHKLTIPRLLKLADYIYRNLTFVEHIALMGLENVGYTPRNMDELWIDPYDYQNELKEAVEYLVQRDMTVSIYNQQLCVTPKVLWPFAKKSISDWKKIYLPQCSGCGAIEQCGGFFKWAFKKHSAYISPI